MGPDVTELLQAWSGGDRNALDRLMPLVYHELRRRATAYLRGERSGHTLQPTALVHEAYLRLVDQNRAVWQNRAQFFGVASTMMRRILVDGARKRRMAKRSGLWDRVSLEDAARRIPAIDVDVLDLDRALSTLASFDARKGQIAELRFFGASRSRRRAKCWAFPLPPWSATGRRRARGSSRLSTQAHTFGDEA